MTVVDVDIETLKSGLGDGSILVVDVREPLEFVGGHIPGAMSLPLSRFDPSELPTGDGRRIVFACAAGVRSMHALAMAQAAGLPLTEHYRGGFKEWAAMGEPVER